MSNRHDPLEISLLGYVVGIRLIWSGWRRFRRRQQVLDAPTCRTAAAPQGTVELQGYAWPSTPFRAPVSGVASVYYRLTVEEYRHSGNSGSWEVVAEDVSEAAFFLADETGLAVLGSSKPAEIEAEPQMTFNWSALTEAQRNSVRDAITKRGGSFNDSSPFFDRVRVRESVIAVGSPLYAYGYFETTQEGLAQLLRPAIGLKRFLEQVRILDRIAAASPATVVIAQRMVSGGLVSMTETQAPANVHDYWARAHGLLRELPEEPLYFANCWQNELLERTGGSFWRVVLGGLCVAGATVVAYLRFTGQLKSWDS